MTQEKMIVPNTEEMMEMMEKQNEENKENTPRLRRGEAFTNDWRRFLSNLRTVRNSEQDMRAHQASMSAARFRSRLDQLMETRGLTAEELSERAEVSIDDVEDVLAGEGILDKKLTFLTALADCFDISVAHLFETNYTNKENSLKAGFPIVRTEAVEEGMFEHRLELWLSRIGIVDIDHYVAEESGFVSIQLAMYDGEYIPTLGEVWKLSDALCIDYTTFVGERPIDAVAVSSAKINMFARIRKAVKEAESMTYGGAVQFKDTFHQNVYELMCYSRELPEIAEYRLNWPRQNTEFILTYEIPASDVSDETLDQLGRSFNVSPYVMMGKERPEDVHLFNLFVSGFYPF